MRKAPRPPSCRSTPTRTRWSSTWELHEHISSAGDEQSAIDVQTSNQIYGLPNETVLEMIEQFDPGVPLIVKSRPLGGFTRAAERTIGVS